MRLTAGIDVGATTTAAGLVTDEGEVVDLVTADTRANGPGSAAGTVLRLLDEVVSRAARRGDVLAGVGIGLPGLVDADEGVMIASANCLTEFVHLPLAEQVRARTGLPAFVDNDVNVLALGESAFGLGRGASSLVLLALGTGLGGGIVIGDRLVRGHAGGAGELGHLSVDLDGPECLCGGRGCLALYTGGLLLARQARREAVEDRTSSLLARAGGDPEAITPALVFAAAAAGDPLAGRLAARTCQALGAGIGAIVNTLNPEAVVVTGGVVGSLASLEAEIRRQAARYALAPLLAATRLHFVPGDKRQTVRGGAALVRYELARERSANPEVSDVRLPA